MPQKLRQIAGLSELKIETVNSFQYGIIDSIQSRLIKRGSAASAKNWLSKGDRIELRPGMAFLGTSSVNTGYGRTSGIRKATRADGVEQLFGTYGKKAKYYDNSTDEWVEIGSDLLGSAVIDSDGYSAEDIFMSEYVSTAGNQMWLNSPNCAGLFKIMTANPGDALDQYDSSKNFKGNIKVDTNAMFLWGRSADKTGIYRSYIDTLTSTTVSSEAFGTGDGSTKTFSRYLDFKTKASSTLTSTGTNVTDGDTTTIGSVTYRYKDTMAAVFDVKRGADAATTLSNLKKAINLSGVAGTNYFTGTTIHPTVEATTLTATTLLIVAKTPGTTANSIATTVSAVTLSFTGATLAGGAVSKRTCFGISITAGSVVLTDDFSGNLSASDGSTGTVNYTTGLVSVTFATAPAGAQAITAAYQWEDSTNHGIADFTKSGTRTAGQGFIIRQDEGGGAAQNIEVYASTYFCFHLKKTWALTISADDSAATNVPYRQNVGIPNVRAAVATGDGIYHIDDSNPDQVRCRVLTYATGGSQQIIPVAVSNNINLSNYYYDQAASVQWGDFVLFSCREKTSPVNNRVIVYNRLWKAWDVLDYCVNCFEIFNGTLTAGDSLSNNFMTLFSGYDDLDNTIDNFWIGNMENMRFEGLKKVKKLYVEGYIQPNQSFDVYLSFDNGNFVKYGTIAGNGPYVDRNQAVDLGSPVLGSKTIGFGRNDAFHYERVFRVNTDRFEYCQVKFVATEIGYVSVQTLKYWDVRFMDTKSPVKYSIN